MSNLIFNDVVIAFNDIDGVHASVPKTVKGGETMTRSYTYNCADFKNLSVEEFINDDDLLHGVVILLDKNTRLAVNSNKSASIPYLNNGSSVASSSMSEVIISTEWYTPLGLRVDGNKTSGLLIRVDRLADGTFRTSKTFGR